MDAPRIRYATAADGTNIAYALVGSGPPLLIVDAFVSGSLEARLGRARLTDFYASLASARMLICFDWRNGGLSGRATDFSLRSLTGDIAAVLAHAGVDATDVFGLRAPATVALAYAAIAAAKVRRLVVASAGEKGRSLRNNDLGGPIAHLIASDFPLFAELYCLHGRGWNEAGQEMAEDFKASWTGVSPRQRWSSRQRSSGRRLERWWALCAMDTSRFTPLALTIRRLPSLRSTSSASSRRLAP
jgi:pimeloyl-ACP methyl ester carboxylesterase